MAQEETPASGDPDVLASLSPEEREELERKRYVKTGNALVWIDPEEGVRREKIANLYYIQTDRGVFRVSRISEEVVPV